MARNAQYKLFINAKSRIRLYKPLLLSVLFLLVFFINTSSATSTKIAAIQYRAVPHNKSENITNLMNLVEQASENGAKIIVLPEMCLTGLAIKNSAQAKILAETIPGPSTNVFAQLAKKHDVYIILGLPEFDSHSKKYYNSQIVIDHRGLIIGKYRKIHLYGSDYNWAEKGDLGYQIAETLWGKIGLGICYDINFSDIFDFFSERGVNIFTFSTNWVGQSMPFPYWLNLLRKRNLYFIAANNWGKEEDIFFSGGSIILSPDLKILAQTDIHANTILYAEISIKQ